MPSTEIYRAIMHCLEGRRVERGLSMATVNDISGLQDGFFSKMIYPDTPSGRQARWETVQLAVEALFGKGFTVHIVAGDAENRRVSNAVLISADISANARNVRHWRHRRHFQELAKKAVAARKKIDPDRWSAICRKGAKKRWKRVREARRQGEVHKAANETRAT